MVTSTLTNTSPRLLKKMFPDKFQEKSVTSLKVLKWFTLKFWGPRVNVVWVYLYTQLSMVLVYSRSHEFEFFFFFAWGLGGGGVGVGSTFGVTHTFCQERMSQIILSWFCRRSQTVKCVFKMYSPRRMVIKAGKHQSWNQRFCSLCWKLLDRAQSFVFCSPIVTA